MWGFFFHHEHPVNYDEARRANVERYRRFFHALLDRGVYLAPSQFEAGFVSLSHEARELDATRLAFREALAELRSD
jgi:glutamate-1-semialdehyde 2,1-aminomutase